MVKEIDNGNEGDRPDTRSSEETRRRGSFVVTEGEVANDNEAELDPTIVNRVANEEDGAERLKKV